MKKLLKRLASRILAAEIKDKNNEIAKLSDARDGLDMKCRKFSEEIERLRQRITDGGKVVLPNSVVAKIFANLPDPNSIGSNKMLKINKPYILTSENREAKISGDNGLWFFEVTIHRVERISDKKVELVIELRNESGRFVLRIPAIVVRYKNAITECDTWVWNLYESGIDALPDHTFTVMYSAMKAWADVSREFFL
ncbi:MAG: hypothetical protein IJT75_01315 [Bacteroidaceae bacterium]|nr:hypothetical protein [Bacteroidaceae bacterium]